MRVSVTPARGAVSATPAARNLFKASFQLLKKMWPCINHGAGYWKESFQIRREGSSLHVTFLRDEFCLCAAALGSLIKGEPGRPRRGDPACVGAALLRGPTESTFTGARVNRRARVRGGGSPPAIYGLHYRLNTQLTRRSGNSGNSVLDGSGLWASERRRRVGG